MDLINYLNNKINDYQVLKSNLLEIYNKIKLGASKLEAPSVHISKLFLLDEASADKKEISKEYKTISEIADTLNTKVIPAIDAKIKSLEKAITEENDRIETLEDDTPVMKVREFDGIYRD
jgi:glutaredoxin 2